MPMKPSIGRRWHEARQLQSLSLTDAAAKIGMATASLAFIEASSALSRTTEEQLAAAAALYDVSVSFLQASNPGLRLWPATKIVGDI